MTPRLKELEATVKETGHGPGYGPITRGHRLGMELGYKLCLEDVEPVLAAARKVLERTDHGNISSYEGCLERLALRDALAQLEVSDA